MSEQLGSRRESLPAGSEMSGEVSTPPESHQPSGVRADHSPGSVVIFHGRVEEPFDNNAPPLHSLHGEVKALPKDQ